MPTQTLEQTGIPKGIQRNKRPFQMKEWAAPDAHGALGITDDFFVVFPSQFASVVILLDSNRKLIGLSDRIEKYLGPELVKVFIDVFQTFNIEKLEIFIRGIRKISTNDPERRKVHVDMPHVCIDILRVDKGDGVDDFVFCAEIAKYMHSKYKILAREMQRFYVDLKYETIYAIYRDCCPNPCDAFFIFDDNYVWGYRHSWYVPTAGRHFKNIKTKRF